MGIAALRSKLEAAIARGAMALPPVLLRTLGGTPVHLDGQTLDSQLQLLLRLQRLSGARLSSNASIMAIRQRMTKDGGILAGTPRTDVQAHAITLAGGEGAIPARLYLPPNMAAPSPALVFFHGGGFAACSLDTHDAPCRELAARAVCVVVSVDYRLAPEHPFPAAVDDAVAAFRDVAARCDEWRLDPQRLAVGGDSAGGNLAAVVAQAVRGDAVAPCFQLLWYPVTDFSRQHPSMQRFAHGFYLEKSKMDAFATAYFTHAGQQLDPRASPLLGDLYGVAPAAVLVAGMDPLRDEGEAYAAALAQAGVLVSLTRYAGLLHGFLNMAGSVHAARVALDDAAAALRHAFARR